MFHQVDEEEDSRDLFGYGRCGFWVHSFGNQYDQNHDKDGHGNGRAGEVQLSDTWYKKGMGGVWCFRLYWVDWSITDVLYVHNITLACRERDYAENTIQTFHKEGMPGTSNYFTSSSKSWDARVHGAVDDPPKRTLVTVRLMGNFYTVSTSSQLQFRSATQ